jgi:uncharacterized protein DUF5069
MKIPGLRHSAEEVGGLVFFGRMLDKMRLQARGELPTDYKHGAGTDLRVCRFLRVEYPALLEFVLDGANDEVALQWCYQRGRQPDDEEIFIFNAFLRKRAWRDNPTPELEEMKRARGFSGRPDIQTFFDFHYADEHEP